MLRDEPPFASRLLILAAMIIIVAALYWAREILIPLALAVLLSFLLAPLANLFERWRVGRIPAVLMVMALALTVLIGIGGIVAGQVVDLATMLPDYKDNIRAKIAVLRVPGSGWMEEFRVTVEEITEDMEADDDGVLRRETPLTGVPVRLVDPPSTPLEMIRQTLFPLVAPVVTAGITIVLMLFILIRREDLRDRFIRLIGQTQINVTTTALDDAAHRISRYLVAMALLCVVHGAIVAIGLLIIGLPNAILWGLLSGLLRFIPFLGPWIAALMPITLALAVGETWQLPLMVIGFIVVLELISNNVLEPWIYGTSTGVSPVAVLLAAVFWTWLWGGLGLLMATPLTVCLVVLGKYVPQLAFFDFLLSDQPVFEPKTRFYQRLLARDHEEATEIAEEFFEQMPLVELYDHVLIPALGLIEHDRHNGRLNQEQQAFVHRTYREVIEDFGHRLDELSSAEKRAGKTSSKAIGAGSGPAASAVPGLDETRVICLPAADEADEIVANMLAQVLRLHGFHCVVGSIRSLANEMIDQVDPRTDVVCVSALPPSAVSHARYLCKRFRARLRDTPLIVGLWSVRIDLVKAATRIGCNPGDKVVIDIAGALAQIRQQGQSVALKGQRPRPGASEPAAAADLSHDRGPAASRD